MDVNLLKEQLKGEEFLKPREPLYIGAYNALRYLIINNFIKGGERLDFSALEECFNVSRVPLREAIHMLSARRLVVHNPNTGTYVIKLNEQDVNEICDIRLMIELHALELSIDKIPLEKLYEWLHIFESEEILIQQQSTSVKETPLEIKIADAELHNSFVRYSERPILLDVYSRIEDYIILMRNINKRIIVSSNEHISIIQAILDKDLAKAKKILEDHLEAVKVVSIAAIKENM